MRKERDFEECLHVLEFLETTFTGCLNNPICVAGFNCRCNSQKDKVIIAMFL